MKIYKKLLKIQKEVNGLKKDKKAFGFDYVTGGKLLSFIKPLMNDNGLILKQEVLSIENVRQNYKTRNGEKEEILSKVMMKFTWIDSETGEKDENLFGANGQNGFDKGVGSALTYAERYFILKYFHISTDEDDIDNPNLKGSEEIKTPPVKVATKPNTVVIDPKLLLTITEGLKNIETSEVLNAYGKSNAQNISKHPQIKALFTSKKLQLNGN